MIRNLTAAACLAAVLSLSGCATAYQSEGFTGGFADVEQSHNSYLVTFAGNGYTSADRATDLAMTRGAELTLMHGYKYMVVFQSDTAMNEDTVYTGYTVSASWKPVSKFLILATRVAPTQFKTYYDAQKLFSDNADKYKLTDVHHLPLKPEVGPFTPDPSVAYMTFPDGTGLAAGDESQLKVYKDTALLDGEDWYLVGDYTYYENPLNTEDDVVAAMRGPAAKHGANALLLVDDPAKVQDASILYGFAVPKTAGFLVEAVYLPQGSLGVEWEPGEIKNNVYVVRRFKNGVAPQKGGLLLGDKVLAVNGVDVLKRQDVMKLARDWKSGDSVNLTVVRNGQEQTVSQKLVPNG